ncbi:TonB-dependent receptor domain-containing protein [Pectobacterium cacticida]|uniref:TonB-dependent receptor domain-containing protein n=1 Tax=Pectobacterium cacticida TaxID=69221 RepID=UPI003985EAE4
MKYLHIANCALAGCLTLPAFAYATEDNSGSVFSALTVSDSSQSEDEEIGSSVETYNKPGAYSSRTVNRNLQSLDTTLRSMSGSYTQLDPLQGAVSINIRGMSGLGRVNTMVDGVTQTYYGVAPASYHGALANSSPGVLIDPNFLAGVDVTRGSSAGSQGVNALAGSANMRTIGVDDLIARGRHIGALSRFSVGDNGLGRTGMIAVAGKTDAFAEGGSIGGLVGLSGSVRYATYKNGGGRSSSDFFGEDNKFMKQKPKSQLYKIDIRPDRYNKLEFSGRNYANTFTRRDIDSDDYYLKYNYSPLSELVDFSVLASTSRSNQDYEPGSPSTYNGVFITNKSNALDMNNTSRFSLGNYDLALHVGGKVMDTKYRRNYVREFDDEGRNGFLPAGTQKISSLYTGVTVNKSIYQLDLNLNYTRSQVKGRKPACADNIKCFPQGESILDLDDKAINPSATLSAQVTPWLQPFVSYSRSSRAPNVQEVLFANEGGGSMNPFLKPEKADTWQAGFNVNKHGLFLAQDTLRLKALAYQTRIKDYIHSEMFFLCYDGSRCKDALNSNPNFQAQMYINSLSPVKTNGYEIEASYDMEYAYVNVSWSKQHTNQPNSITGATQMGFGYDDMADLPNSYASVDVGGRLFDKKLVIGSLIKFTGKSKRFSTLGVDSDTSSVPKEDMPHIPTIVDLYANYRVNDNVLLRFSVQNAGNKDYAEALNRLNQDITMSHDGESLNTTARGRTYVFGGEIRF